MNGAPHKGPRMRLDPEKVAHWYFRLNGFLQIENFVVHPSNRGGQRTDADLLGVRFPHRAERLFDNPDDIMQDDEQRLSLSPTLTDVIIAEVKTNQPCALNGPWTRQDKQNVHRVLAAIGCLPQDRIEQAAADIYQTGIHESDLGIRIRLVAVGRNPDGELSERYPGVPQLTWPNLLGFIWHRFHEYQRQKKQIDQWEEQGRLIKRLADQSGSPCDFTNKALRLMGVQFDNAAG